MFAQGPPVPGVASTVGQVPLSSRWLDRGSQVECLFVTTHCSGHPRPAASGTERCDQARSQGGPPAGTWAANRGPPPMSIRVSLRLSKVRPGWRAGEAALGPLRR